MGKKIRLAGIAYESLVNGPGMRRVFFAQGCKHNCDGCFNKDTHDFSGGEERDIDLLVDDLRGNGMIKGVTFSGGDPLEQADKFAYLAKECKKIGLNVWCYTGYTFEDIIENLDKIKGWNELLNNLDVLVDGKFEISKKRDGLKFKGSTNQRIIDVKESLKNNSIKLIEF